MTIVVLNTTTTTTMSSQNTVVHISSSSEFTSVLKQASGAPPDTAYNALIVDFSAAWCGPCKYIAPLYEKLAKKTPSLRFLHVDVDECHELSAQYKIEAMPTFIAIHNGTEVSRMMGANLDTLKKMVAQVDEHYTQPS